MAKTQGSDSTEATVVDNNSPSTVSPAEFAKIPLDFIIATPLLTTIEAHKAAANTTLSFIESIKDKSTEFNVKVSDKDANGNPVLVDKKITVPLLAIVKIPSLTFDSISVSFNYNISQVYKEEDKSAQNAELKVSTKGVLSKFLDASLTGSIEHSRTRENVANRGGSLEIKIHVSETQIPSGLEKIINGMVESIEIPIKK